MSPIGMDDHQLSVVEKEALGECFASAEARFEYEKARRLRQVLSWVGGTIALVGFGVFMYWLGSCGQARTADGQGSGGASGTVAHKPLDAKPVGSAQAKVQVLAILPEGSDCHSGIAKFLADTATKHPEQIRVEYSTIAEYGEKKLESQVGSVCAAILINGVASFEVTCAGKARKVSLVGTEPTHYSTADVGEALTSVFVQQYGDPGEPIFVLPAGATCGAAGGATCTSATNPGAAGDKSGSGATSAAPATPDSGPIELPGFREMKSKP